MGNVSRTKHTKHAEGSGGKRIKSGRKPSAPTKTVSFKVPVFVDPAHEVQLKAKVKPVIDEFIVGKERVQ